jgi:hypothetical protein
MILDPNVERLTLLGTLPKSFATALLTIDSNAYMVGTKDGDLESGDRRTKRTNTFKRKDTSTSEERTRAGIIRALVRIDEHRIASTEANVPHVRIWDLRHAGRELHTIRDTTPSPRDRVWATNPTPHAIDSIALMPNGNLVTNSSRKAITVWSPTWQRIKTIRAIDGNRISTYKELMPITHRYVMGAAHSVTLDLIDIDHGTCTKMPNIFANTMTSLHDRSLALGAYDGITILNPPPAIMIPWLLTQRMRTSNEADHAVDDANQHSQ